MNHDELMKHVESLGMARCIRCNEPRGVLVHGFCVDCNMVIDAQTTKNLPIARRIAAKIAMDDLCRVYTTTEN